MKISTKGRYTLRLMLDLAVNDISGDYVTIKSVSERQDISIKYLEQLVTKLNKAGFVKSARGAHGGYKLTKEPKDYTVGMILDVVEGELAPVSCLEKGSKDCERANCCTTLKVWEKIQAAVSDVVEHITLQDLVDSHNGVKLLD